MGSAKFTAWWDRFRRTGDICPVQLGISREELRSRLGDPDDTSTTSRGHRHPAVWKYGDLEFHFGHAADDRLCLIYMDTEDGAVRVSIGDLT